MALPATDTFTTGADAALTTYSASWSMNTGAAQVLAASDDFHANSATTEVGAFHNVETYNNDQYSQITVKAISDAGFVGAACRCAGAGVASYYGFYVADTTDYLFKMVTGTFTQLGSTGAGAAVSDVIRVEASGTSISPKRNGSVPGTPGTQTDSSLASGKAGITGWNNSSAVRGDDFEGGNLTTSTLKTPEYVGSGTQAVTTTVGATLAPSIHASTAVGDLMVMIIAGRPNGSTITNTFSNTWNFAGERFREIGAGNTDLYVGVYTRIAGVGESAPTVTPDADFPSGGTTGGVSAQIATYRYCITDLDVAAAVNDAAAAATWTPPSVSTVTPNCMVISCVATADDNALDLNTANSFSLAMSGAGFDTTTGSDHAVGMAYLLAAATGAVTMCIWNQSAVGNDVWAGVTIALRPLPYWWRESSRNYGQAVRRANI